LVDGRQLGRAAMILDAIHRRRQFAGTAANQIQEH
jgi:hypothetical protein